MYLTLFRLRLKCLCKSYNLLVLLFIFPIFISTLYYLGFYNVTITNSYSITLSIVDESDYLKVYNYFQDINELNEKEQFSITLSKREEAVDSLKTGVIDGYIVMEEVYVDANSFSKPVLFVKDDGVKQTTIKAYLDMYELDSREGVAIGKIDRNNFVSMLASENENKDYTLLFFYAMISLICLLGANLGFKEMVDFHSEESFVGKRVSVSSVKARRLLTANLGAIFTVHLTSILLLLVYFIQVLGVIPRKHLLILFLICLFGSILAISLGAFIHVFFKVNKTIKRGGINVIIFGGSFAAGLMFTELKYYIMSNFPLINLINPASLITDALYYLYQFEDYNKVIRNMLVLIVWSIILSFIAFVPIRRNYYASN